MNFARLVSTLVDFRGAVFATSSEICLCSPMSQGTDNHDLAQDRTDWAEDRTMLANERTYAAWMRTGMASLGVGLALNALFGRLEPVWIPKAVATFFAIIAILIFALAVRKSQRVAERLNCHDVEQIGIWPIRLIGGTLSLGALMFVALVWGLDWQ